jgi:hypothetical protein
MQFERGKPPETPNAPYRAARMKDERWSSAGPGFEPGRAGPRLSYSRQISSNISRSAQLLNTSEKCNNLQTCELLQSIESKHPTQQ